MTTIKKLRKYWQLFWLFRYVRLMVMMEYRSNFYLWSTISLMWTLFNFFFFTILVDVSGQIGGWNKNELYVLLGYFTIMDAIIWSFIARNMHTYTESVTYGSLSLLLTKPIDTQYILMTQDNGYSNLPRLVIGIYVLITAIGNLTIAPNFTQILFSVAACLFGLLLIYAIWFILATLSLYVEKLNNIHEVVPALRRTMQVPRTVYTGLSSTLLTVILPLALATSIPSEILLGKNSWVWLVYLMLFSSIALFMSRLFLHSALKKYQAIGG